MAEAIDRSQGCLEIVGNGVSETLKLRVSVPQLTGTFRNALFELRNELAVARFALSQSLFSLLHSSDIEIRTDDRNRAPGGIASDFGLGQKPPIATVLVAQAAFYQ